MSGPDTLPGLDDYLTPDDPVDCDEFYEEVEREMERQVTAGEDQEFYRDTFGWN